MDLFYHQFTPDITSQLRQEFNVGGGRENQHYIQQAAEHAWPVARILAEAHAIFRPSQANNITLETFKENVVAKILIAHLKAGGPGKAAEWRLRRPNERNAKATSESCLQ